MTIDEAIIHAKEVAENKCEGCNYFQNGSSERMCNNWNKPCITKRACYDGIISDNEKFEKLLHKCIEDGRKRSE